MSTFRLLSLGTLLTSVFIGTGDAQSTTGDRRWTVFAPPPVSPALYAPSAIAVGPDGTVFVTDAANGRVQLLSTTGQALSQWDSHLAYPAGIAVGRDGSVYVTDARTGRLVRFSRVGEVSWTVQLAHTGKRGHSLGYYPYYPMRPAVTPSGEVYVLHGDGTGVWLSHVSRAGRLLKTRQLQPRHPPPGDACNQPPCEHLNECSRTFTLPEDIGSDAGGRVYTAAGGFCTQSVYVILQVWSPEDKLLHEWNLGLRYDPEYPIVLAVDQQSRVTLAASGNPATDPRPLVGLIRLSADGQSMSRWGLTPCGEVGGDPSGLAADRRGLLYLVDRSHRTVQRFARGLSQQAIWGCPPYALPAPWSLAVDAEDAIYVSTGDGRIVKLAPNGRKLAVWENIFPRALSVDSNGEIYVIRVQHLHSIVEVLSPSGVRLRQWSRKGDGFTKIIADGHGRVYVSAYHLHVYQGLSHILVYTRSGQLIAVWGGKTRRASQQSLATTGCVAADVNANIYCLATWRVIKVSPEGQVLATWSIPKPGADQVAPDTPASWPWFYQSVAVDRHGDLYLDYSAGVIELSSAGRMLGQWGRFGFLPGQFVNAAGLIVDSRGTLYVADWGNNQIQRLSAG